VRTDTAGTRTTRYAGVASVTIEVGHRIYAGLLSRYARTDNGRMTQVDADSTVLETFDDDSIPTQDGRMVRDLERVQKRDPPSVYQGFPVAQTSPHSHDNERRKFQSTIPVGSPTPAIPDNPYREESS